MNILHKLFGKIVSRGSDREYTRKLDSNEQQMAQMPYMLFRFKCPTCESTNTAPWGKVKDGLATECRSCGAEFIVTQHDDQVTVKISTIQRRQEWQRCEICKRPVFNLGKGAAGSFGYSGTILDVSAMKQGLEGPGDECQHCGRIYCTRCARTDTTCVCGSKIFRVVRLRYEN